MDLYEKLLEQKNKTFTIEELKLLSKIDDYEKFAEEINGLTEENKLAPIKASGTNGRKINRLYNKYKLAYKPKEYAETFEEIKLLSSEFNHQAYLDKPEEYLKCREEIRALDEFLKTKRYEVDVPASINERSFQIWGKEKLLKEKSIIQRIFSFNNLDLKMLNYYETPEPFFEYIHSYDMEMKILIIENKDTWYTMRKLMSEKYFKESVNNYNVLLYGEGKKVIRNNDMLSYYDKEILKNSKNRYFYFGDLDYEGIGIFTSLKKLYPELDIVLDVKFYELMLDICHEDRLPVTKEGQQETELGGFIEYFGDGYQEKIKSILKRGRYIPQEIINYKVFSEMLH
jgi:hypothetical protein